MLTQLLFMLLLAIYTECRYYVKQNGLNLQMHYYINLSTRLQKSAFIYTRKYADKDVQCAYCVFPPLTTFSTFFLGTFQISV